MHPFSQQFLARAATEDGGAAKLAEKAKRDAYLPDMPQGFKFVPLLVLVVEIFGRMGEEGEQLFSTLVKRVAERTMLPKGVCTATWRMRLSMALQREQARIILHRAGKLLSGVRSKYG